MTQSLWDNYYFVSSDDDEDFEDVDEDFEDVDEDSEDHEALKDPTWKR